MRSPLSAKLAPQAAAPALAAPGPLDQEPGRAARLRLFLSCAHTPEQIDQTLDALQAVMRGTEAAS